LLLLLSPLQGTDHLIDGGKKDATFVASLFDPWVTKLDPLSQRVDCVFFDGASNVQKAGRLLEAKYPQIHVQACAAHSVSLFFSDISKKLWQIKLMLVNYRRVYRLFGSGAMHSPYALFIEQSKNFNGGRKVGLLKAADTRMAGHAYAQCRMLRLRGPLVATITSAAYKDLKLKGFPLKVEEFLLDNDMWEATYTVQRCLFPMIRVLRLSDKSACGGMSKILYYVHKTDEAIGKSMEALKDLKYFADHEPADADEEEGIDLVDDGADSDDSDQEETEELSDDEAEASDDEEVLHLGEKISAFWYKRRQKLITPLSIAAWFCSPHPDIRADVVAHEIGADRLVVEEVIAKLYYPIGAEKLGGIIQVFWRELDDFQTKRGPSYSRSWIWESDEIKQGNCHLWHKLYSVPFTKVFGKVACRVCSKPLGCGLAERNWGALKHLKTGKRSHLSGDKAQKQATVFGAACMERSKIMQAAEESNGVVQECRWTDADIAFELGLERWDGGPGNVPTPEVPKRLFNAWIEDWEWDLIHDKDSVAEAKLLHKYHGMKWIDPDNDDEVEWCTAADENMDWQGGRNGEGWCVIGTRDNDGGMEPWSIDVVIDLIADCEQPPELHVEVIINEELRAANKERYNEEVAKRKEKKKEQARKRKK
jgi:hypothetical protein